MCCIEISEPGEPSVLKDVERPVPEPKNNEILIKVGAAGINRPDVLQRKGLYPPPPDASDLPGLEVAGVIVKIGPSVTDFQIGDEVCALTPGGGYAEYCVAPQEQSLHIPKGLTAIEAAAIPETFLPFGLIYLSEGVYMLAKAYLFTVVLAALVQPLFKSPNLSV